MLDTPWSMASKRRFPEICVENSFDMWSWLQLVWHFYGNAVHVHDTTMGLSWEYELIWHLPWQAHNTAIGLS